MSTYAIPSRESDAGDDDRPVVVDEDDCDVAYDAWVDDGLEEM